MTRSEPKKATGELVVVIQHELGLEEMLTLNVDGLAALTTRKVFAHPTNSKLHNVFDYSA